MSHKFLILDFGSQLTQLIARRLRDLNYYSEIHKFDYPLEKILEFAPAGIILSGGPSSVYENESPQRSIQELASVAPLLGICYGMQLIAHQLGGKVERSQHREYGFNRIKWSQPLGNIPQEQRVWMSHGDIVNSVPRGFEIIGWSEAKHPAAMRSDRIWAVQFHPEVTHTDHGIEVLLAFAKNLCKANPIWNPPHITDHLKSIAQNQVGANDHVLCALSGGVDSSVVATLLSQALGKERVHCLFVDTGLLRKDEYSKVLAGYGNVGLNVTGLDCKEVFLRELKGIVDPEKKRKIIGRLFIEIFERNLPANKNIKWLAQGTLYPDVIESFSVKGGPSQTIKSHHNVGGLPENMKLKLIEPLRELFKDEVRKIGSELGLPQELLWRHPFPGPGLAIRIIGEVTEESLRILQEADAIFIEKLKEKSLYHKIWQAFCVLLSVKTVGVQGDGRTYDQVLALRAVTSHDGMTADWFSFDYDFLREVSSEITNKVHGISRVVYDITSKPPATIEWE